MEEPRIIDKVVDFTLKRNELTPKEKVISFMDNWLLGKSRKRAEAIALESRISRATNRIDAELLEAMTNFRAHFAGRIMKILKEEMER